MKKLMLSMCVASAAFLLFGCGAPATNTGNAVNTANSNANAKPAAAAPTADALLALDRQANEAYFKGDSKFFEGFISDKMVMGDGGERMGKAEVIKMIGGVKCDIKEGWKLEEPQMSKIDADTYALTYKGTFDGTCTENGKTEKAPSPIRAATVFVRNADKWQAAYHNETPIIDPKAPPPPAPSKKEEPKKDDKPAANSNSANTANAAPAPAKPAPSANTDALVKMHQAGWEAFKAKDAKWFNDNLSSTFALVDPMGNYVGTKADTVKLWTETMKCEGITNVKVSDGFSTAISPTVEIITLKGTADGTCDGQKNGDLYQTAVYVKEGDAWKLAFMFEKAAA